MSANEGVVQANELRGEDGQLAWRIAHRPGEVVAVLLMAIAVLALFAVGCLAVGTVAHAAMKRLGLELWSVLLWLGLAEDPRSQQLARRGGPPRLTVVDAPRQFGR